MPVTFSFSDDGEEVELRLVGTITSEEYVEFFRGALSTSSPPRRIRTTLMDLLEGDTSQLTLEAVREVAALTAAEAHRNPGLRALAAVVRDPLTFGLTRQWNLFTNDPRNRLEIFTTRESAERWLRQQRELAPEDGEAPARGA
ncbi:MAG: hypothetical protein U0704_01600 [Candidatus Eisenbacteria bacterium]